MCSSITGIKQSVFINRVKVGSEYLKLSLYTIGPFVSGFVNGKPVGTQQSNFKSEVEGQKVSVFSIPNRKRF